jgi:hypothetical protein
MAFHGYPLGVLRVPSTSSRSNHHLSALRPAWWPAQITEVVFGLAIEHEGKIAGDSSIEIGLTDLQNAIRRMNPADKGLIGFMGSQPGHLKTVG